VVAGTDEIAEALWYVAPGRAEIRSERLPPLQPGHVRVRTRHTALSRGTESLVAGGRVPESEYQRMRAPFMGGTFPFPVKYGYANVGRVEAGPLTLVGKEVFSLSPHQSVFDLPEGMAVPLPDGVPASRAVLSANMETALNAMWDAEPKDGAKIAVVGAGVLGALVGFLAAKVNGADVTLVDINPARAKIASAFGIGFATPENAPVDRDLVIHTSASAAGLTTSLNLCADEATVLELSWYGAGTVAVPLGGAFHSRRLKLISSQVGKVAPSRRATHSYRRRLEEAMALLADSRLDVLLAPPVKFHDLPARLPDIFAPQSGILCQLITY
jgi:threonine dehydrogenase-like Zn-dependent dehydrogenase